MRGLTIVFGFACLLMVSLATAGEVSIQQFPLPGHGTLVIAVPDAWKTEVAQPPDALPPTLRFLPKSGAAFEILVTPLWSMTGKSQAMDAANVRQEVDRSAEAAKPQAVERVLTIKSLQGSSGVGYYFSATDRSPKPGEYKYLTQGIIPVGELAVVFTILSNDGGDATVDAALLLLQDATQKKPGAP